MHKILITISLAFLLLVSPAVSTAKELSMICTGQLVVANGKVTAPSIGYVLADGTLYQDDKKYPCTATKTILKCGLSPTKLNLNAVILKTFEIDLVSGMAKITENFKEEQWDCTPLIANTEELKKIPPTRVLAKEFRFVDKPSVESSSKFTGSSSTLTRLFDDKTGKWGFIDKQGKWVIQPRFDAADIFSDGLAAVRIGDDKTGKWGFIDKDRWVIQPQFDDTFGFRGGVAMVWIGRDSFHIRLN